MRIVSYNVRYFGHRLKGLASTRASKRAISDALAGLTPLPDLVCLQEVETQSLRSSPGRAKGENQLDAFLREMQEAFGRGGLHFPYASYYFPAHVYGVKNVNLYTTGLAVLVNQNSLRVIKDNKEKPQAVTSYGLTMFRPAKQTRIVAHLHLEDAHNRSFHLFNTHLSLPSWRSREFWTQPHRMGFGPNQLDEAKILSNFAVETSKREPFLVVGDFNALPNSPVYAWLTREEKWVGAQEALKQIDPNHPDQFHTAGFLNLRMHLDHVFGHAIEWIDLQDTLPFDTEKSPFFRLSDHTPLIASFDLQGRRR